MAENKLFSFITGKISTSPEADYFNYNLAPELEEFNKADTVNMTPDEMNKFRHIAGSKQTLNDMGLWRGTKTLLGKEFYDLLKGGDSKKDTLFDLKNDMRALKLHFKKPDLEENQLYDYVFQNYIKPYRK